ncbi:EAL domain-containing protein [Thalassotalea ganghwensis]
MGTAKSRILDTAPAISRLEFMTIMEQALLQARQSLSLIVLKINQLHETCLSIGLTNNEQVLSQYLQRIEITVNESANVGRMGDDGFAILINEDREISLLVLELMEVLSRPFILNNACFDIVSSVGYGVANEFIDDAYDFLSTVEKSLTSVDPAKRQYLGGFNPKILEKERREQLVEHRLRAAIKQEALVLNQGKSSDVFALHYQPQVSSLDYSIIGVEALLRWQDTELGFVSPEEFIPIAERIDALNTLTKWVVLKSFQDITTLNQYVCPETFKLSINISPTQLIKASVLLSLLESALKRYDILPSRVVIELTEDLPLTEFANELQIISDLGCQLALDDFGTGYSSMHTLRTMPLDYAKLDKSFVTHLYTEFCNNTSADESMIRTFQVLCNSLGLKSVIEGVETQEQRDFLRSMGCKALQGYFFSKPVPLDELSELVKNEPYKQVP